MKAFFKTFLFILFTIAMCVNSGCDSPQEDVLHLQKKYWDATDYENAIDHFGEQIEKKEKLPCYADPAQKAVFMKLVDVNNFKVVMDDTALGINHRKEFSHQMFENYQKLFQAYQTLDVQDKFVYPRELAEIMCFGMEFQISYFKLGNEGIRKEADNPNAQNVLDVIHDNEQALVNNLDIDLSYAKREKAFSAEALEIYAAGVDKFFKQLIIEFPNADYSEMLSKAQLMQDKAETPVIKNMLTNLIALLQTKVKEKSK